MWWYLALVSAVCLSLRHSLIKHLGHKLDEFINVWGRFTFAVPFAFLYILYDGIPEIQDGFYLITFIGTFFWVGSDLLLSKSFKHSDISISVTLFKLHVIFMLIAGMLFLNEIPSINGAIGIFITLIGIYILNIKKARLSLLKPFHILFTDIGLRYALLGSIVFGSGIYFFKTSILLSSPAFATLIYIIFASLLVTPLAIKKSRRHFRAIPKNLPQFIIAGISGTISSIATNTAFTLTVAAYVSAVKQMDAIFTLFLGMIIFKEKDRVKEIWPGALIMILGVIVLILSK